MGIKSSNRITLTEQDTLVEIKEWYLTTDIQDESQLPPKTPEFWNEIRIEADFNKPYVWNYEESIYELAGSKKSSARIVAKYYGIKSVTNYYQTTQTSDVSELSDDKWRNDFAEAAKEFTEDYKYLWSCEEIIYVDYNAQNYERSERTDPVIIGVYGESGKDAVSFGVYTKDGDEFVDDVHNENVVDEITIYSYVFLGSIPATNVSYEWSYYDSKKEEYIPINISEEDIKNGTLTVSSVDEYALSTIRCQINVANYGIYTDYITLKKRSDVYSINIGFVDSSNVFNRGQDFIIAYANVYKNGVNDDESNVMYHDYLTAHEYVSGEYVGVTNKNLDEFADGEERIIIYKDVDKKNCLGVGKYNRENNKWLGINPDVKYAYNFNQPNANANLLLISKSEVDASLQILVSAFINTDNDEQKFVASSSASVIDLNDTVVSDEPPAKPYNGQMWLNLSSNSLFVYNSESQDWAAAKSGQSTYTSQPSVYKKGDLWILDSDFETYLLLNIDSIRPNSKYYIKNGDGVYEEVYTGESVDNTKEYYGKIAYDKGEILKAITDSSRGAFDITQWEPAVNLLGDMVNYTQTWDGKVGLKIGQDNGMFHINIDSKEIGFYDNTIPLKPGEQDEDRKPVVHINNQSAHVTKLEVEETAEFKSKTTFRNSMLFGDLFELKFEEDGSISLVVAQENI